MPLLLRHTFQRARLTHEHSRERPALPQPIVQGYAAGFMQEVPVFWL